MSNNLLLNNVGHWTFDEGPGTDFADSTANGNTIIERSSNGPSLGGIIGNSVQWFQEPSNQWASANRDSALEFSGAPTSFTIACYVNIKSPLNSNFAIFSQWSTPGNQRSYFLGHVRANDEFLFLLSSDGSTNAVDIRVGSVGTTQSGVWYHVAAVRDVQNGMAHLYVSDSGTIGDFGSASTAFSGATSLFASTSDHNVSRADLSSTFYAHAFMDELAVWDRALTVSDLQDHYNGGSGLDRSLWELGTAGAGTGPDAVAASTSPFYYYRR